MLDDAAENMLDERRERWLLLPFVDEDMMEADESLGLYWAPR